MVEVDRPHAKMTSNNTGEGSEAEQHNASLKTGASSELGASPEPGPDRLTRRSIRSFVVRNGRQTSAQTEALAKLMPRHGIPFQSSPLDLSDCFGRVAPCWLEIGFGNGDSLLHTASVHPEINFIGVEVHAPGIGHALNGIEQRELPNVRLIHHDAIEVLQHMIEPGAVDRIILLYPDPWHKKRHHKRRIVQKEFLDAVATALREQGTLHCATDWEDYANWMEEHLVAHEAFSNTTNGFATKPAYRVSSRFERRGERLGHQVFDLLYQRR